MCANISKTKYSSQYIHNHSFDDDFKLQMFKPAYYDPATDSVKEYTPRYIVRFQVDSSNPSVYYIGLATPGTLESEAKWRLQRYDFSAGAIGIYADGDTNFDNIYDNRESLSY